MEGRHHEGGFPCLPFAAVLRKGKASAEQEPARLRAKGEDHLGLDGFELLAQERCAGGELFALGRPVVGRVAFEDVGGVDICAIERHGAQHIVEQLSCIVRKCTARGVIFDRRRLTNEEEARVGIAFAKDDVGACLAQAAACAIAERFADGCEALFGVLWCAVRCDRSALLGCGCGRCCWARSMGTWALDAWGFGLVDHPRQAFFGRGGTGRGCTRCGRSVCWRRRCVFWDMRRRRRRGGIPSLFRVRASI